MKINTFQFRYIARNSFNMSFSVKIFFYIIYNINYIITPFNNCNNIFLNIMNYLRMHFKQLLYFCIVIYTYFPFDIVIKHVKNNKTCI